MWGFMRWECTLVWKGIRKAKGGQGTFEEICYGLRCRFCFVLVLGCSRVINEGYLRTSRGCLDMVGSRMIESVYLDRGSIFFLTAL